jgi:putative FmdB family regulatory protein
MPLYEYYCQDCDGVFELLRPVRQSSDPQPCPECDRDAKRMMPVDFAAFTVRDGLPRRIPDRGTFWHLGKEVSRPVNEPARAWEHPDLDKDDPVAPPSAEEVERFDHQLDIDVEQEMEATARGMNAIQPQKNLERAKFLERLVKTGGAGRLRPRGQDPRVDSAD